MAAIKRLMAFVFSHYITSLGVRTLASGVVEQTSADVVIEAGDVRPHFANHINEGEFEFLILPLYHDTDEGPVPTVSVESGTVRVNSELQEEVCYDLDSLNLPERFWWVTDNDNVVVQLRGTAPSAGVLKAVDSAKTAKRLKEYLRLTTMAVAGKPQMLQLDHYPHEWTDGRAAVSQSYACDMVLAAGSGRPMADVKRDIGNIKSGKVATMLLRVMGPEGTLKVEANIVPALPGGVDIAFHAAEWKREVRYGLWLAHGELKGHTHGAAFMDTQTSSWMGEWMFPLPLMKGAVTSMFQAALEAIRRDEIPEWLISELELDQDGDFVLGHSRDLQDQAKSYVKWQSHGLGIRQSANLSYMAYQGLAQRAEAKDLFAPVVWSLRGHVCTQAFLTEVCGYEVAPEYAEKVYFDERVSCLVYPTELFLALSASHGGWDQDGDSVVIALRQTTTGGLVGVCWRNPNSPGEYAIVQVGDESIPWEFTDGDIPTVDLALRPKFLDEVRATQTLKELAKAPKGSGEWTHEVALRELETQLANPGIGRVANALIVYSACTNGASPDWMYAMEDMVDTCMQTRYLPAFEQIEEWIKYMHAQIEATGRIDAFLAGKCSIGGRKISPRLPSAVMRDMRVYDGYYTQLHKHVKAEVARYRDEMQKESFRLRRAYPIGSLADEVSPFSPQDRGAVNRGRSMVDWANEQFEAAARQFPRSRDLKDPLNKAHRSAANRAVVDKAVDTLKAMSQHDRSVALIAAYRYTCESTPNHPLGKVDRILYAYGSPGKTSVLDLWIDTLVRTGDATRTALWNAAINAEVDTLVRRVRESTEWVRPGDNY